MNSSEKSEQEYIKIYAEFADAIFRHCYYRISHTEEAEDMVQVVFMKGWQNIQNGKDVKNIRALLYKIANDAIVDYYRKKKPVSLDNLQESGFDPSGTDFKAEMENIIEGKDMINLLGQLDSKYRESVIMRFIDDLSPKEIAEITGESENNVSVRINRGLKQIREMLNKE